MDQSHPCTPETIPSRAAVAVSNGVRASAGFEAVDEVDEVVLDVVVFALLNSGIQPPSANHDPRFGKNILISGRLEKLETISSI